MTMSRQCFYSSSGGATMKNNTYHTFGTCSKNGRKRLGLLNTHCSQNIALNITLYLLLHCAF